MIPEYRCPDCRRLLRVEPMFVTDTLWCLCGFEEDLRNVTSGRSHVKVPDATGRQAERAAA